MHTLSHFEIEQLQARKGSQVPKMIGLTAQQTLRHKPHVRLARILDRAEAEKARQKRKEKRDKERRCGTDSQSLAAKNLRYRHLRGSLSIGYRNPFM